MDFKIEKIFNSSTKVPITVGAGSFVVGTAVGMGISYILERRKNKPARAHEVPRRIFEASDLFDTPVATDVELKETDDGVEATGTLTEEGAALLDAVEELHDGDRIIPHPDETEESAGLEPQSIFAKTEGEFDLEEEQKNRSSQVPYVLHRDEFHQDELGYPQTTLTYYEADAILADTDDKPIYAFDRITGPLRFGFGSGDSNVVYIRNDKMRTEYEVIRDPGYFSVEVLGLEIEDNERARDLKHAHGIPRLPRDARD